jgi:hypothetical protein
MQTIVGAPFSNWMYVVRKLCARKWRLTLPIPAWAKPQIKAYNDESFKQFQIGQGMTYLNAMWQMFMLNRN